MGHEAALGVLGDSAFLIMLVFFAVAGLIVIRGLRDAPGSHGPLSETEEPTTDRDHVP